MRVSRPLAAAALSWAVVAAATEPQDSARAVLLLRALGYDRKLVGGTEPFKVAVVGPAEARTALVAQLSALQLVLAQHPVVLLDCEAASSCRDAVGLRAVLLLPKTAAAAEACEVAHRAGRYTLALEPGATGAMFSLDAASRLVLDAEALAQVGVDLEPSLVSRATFAPKRDRAATEDAVPLPEEAEPPRERPGNPRPEFPVAARDQGQEGEVVLRVAVRTDGSVGAIEVLKGERTFTEPTVAAVRRWQFQPATLEGKPLAVFKIVKVPFRLR